MECVFPSVGLITVEWFDVRFDIFTISALIAKLLAVVFCNVYTKSVIEFITTGFLGVAASTVKMTETSFEV